MFSGFLPTTSKNKSPTSVGEPCEKLSKAILLEQMWIEDNIRLAPKKN